MTVVAEYSRLFTGSKEAIDPLNVLSGNLKPKKDKDKDLERILAKGFFIPNVTLEQNVGFAQTIAFVRDLLSSNVRGISDAIIDTEIKPEGIEVRYKLDSSKQKDISLKNLQYIFAFLVDTLEGEYHPHASVSERLYKSAGKQIALSDESEKLEELFLGLFRRLHLDVENHKYSEFGSLEVKSFTQKSKFKKVNELDLRLLKGNDSWSYYNRYLNLSSNIYAIDEKVFNAFLKSKESKKFKKYKRDSPMFIGSFGALQENAIKTIGSRLGYLYQYGEYADRVNYSDKDGQFLIAQLLELANYSDDSSFLIDYYGKGARKRRMVNKLYTFAELWATNIDDDYYIPKRRSQKLGEARSLKSSVLSSSSIVTALQAVNPTTVIELLPAMGYKLDSQTEDQAIYVNLLIQTLANKYKNIEANDSSRHSFSHYKSKAEEETKAVRNQTETSALLYGRTATRLFLDLDNEKIAIIEAVDKNKIIENGQKLDNILIGLITGLAKF